MVPHDKWVHYDDSNKPVLEENETVGVAALRGP